MPPPTVNRKRLLWTLTLMTLLAAVGTAVVRHQVTKRKAGLAAQAARKKEKNAASEKPSNNRPPPAKKEPKVTVLSQAAKEHLAENSFIAALRSVFLWRNTQPPGSPETTKALLDKLSAIACDELPPERRNAWHALLRIWRDEADPAKTHVPDAGGQSEIRQAADVLNAMFKAHGDGDLTL